MNLTQLFSDVQNVEGNEGVGDLQNVDDGFAGVNENKTKYKVVGEQIFSVNTDEVIKAQRADEKLKELYCEAERGDVGEEYTV